jgi:hypothetical protein
MEYPIFYHGKLTEWELIHADTTWEPYKKL